MDGGIQAVEGGSCGGERNLLFENDVDERGEAGFANPQRGLAVLSDYSCQMSVAIRQHAHTFIESGLVQDGLRSLHGKITVG